MKYTSEIEINSPVDRVIELFDNPDNMDKWMKGLQSFELISGKQGQVGAKSRLKFKMGKREIEMIETVTARNLPDEFSGTYETKGLFNSVKNKFISLPENRTKFISEQEFQFKGFMKVIGMLMSSAFKKQSMQYLINFKNFVEKS
jgi:uncharacterized membrane protein